MPFCRADVIALLEARIRWFTELQGWGEDNADRRILEELKNLRAEIERMADAG